MSSVAALRGATGSISWVLSLNLTAGEPRFDEAPGVLGVDVSLMMGTIREHQCISE